MIDNDLYILSSLESEVKFGQRAQVIALESKIRLWYFVCNIKGTFWIFLFFSCSQVSHNHKTYVLHCAKFYFTLSLSHQVEYFFFLIIFLCIFFSFFFWLKDTHIAIKVLYCTFPTKLEASPMDIDY